VRNHDFYGATAEAHDRDASLTAVDVRRSPLSRVCTIVDVIFSYTRRQTDVTEKLDVPST
jgi:hypothetical protein